MPEGTKRNAAFFQALRTFSIVPYDPPLLSSSLYIFLISKILEMALSYTVYDRVCACTHVG